jgi:hypothetical protein
MWGWGLLAFIAGAIVTHVVLDSLSAPWDAHLVEYSTNIEDRRPCALRAKPNCR